MTVSLDEPKNYVLCHHCDLLSELPLIADHHKATCPRCNTNLARANTQMKRDTVIFSSCALVMLFFSCYFVFIDIRVMGIINQLNILVLPDILYQDNYPSLVLIFLLFVLIIPVTCSVLQIALCSGLRLSKFRQRDLLILHSKLHRWAMPEIFIAGVLVSFVKLTSYGDVGINKSFLPFCLFVIFYLKSLVIFSKREIWNGIATNNFSQIALVAGETGIQQNIRLCTCCHSILPADLNRCPRCKTKGTLRDHKTVQWTMALLFTSLLLYIPANIYGVMSTVFLGSESHSTIIDGVIYMWQEGDYPVALVIFTASVVIPVLKILALSWLCYFALSIRNKAIKECVAMHKLYTMVEFIGRWSMIDVFVVSVISALIRNGEMMAVYPYIGVVFFASVVVVTMVASHKYDPRMIWDKIK